MLITHHRLQVNDPQGSLLFYQEILGMKLIHQIKEENNEHYFLAFSHDLEASLELVYMPDVPFSVAVQPSKTEGYWKFSIAVNQLDEVREKLLANGVITGPGFEVPNLAYLCHIVDPDGYCIELIQRTMRDNIPTVDIIKNHPLGIVPTFNLSTLRVKDIDKSVTFYESLGFTLVYSYRADARAMTLYFLISKNDVTFKNSHSLSFIEEAMWQHSSTFLELQQFDHTAQTPDFSYRTGTNTGFLGIDIKGCTESLKQYEPDIDELNVGVKKVSGVILKDPDGYQIRYYA